MKKLLLLAPFLCSCLFLSAQHRNSEDILKKLMWDDEKLSVLVDTRFDYQANWHGSELDQSSLKTNCLKLWLVGDITPKIHFRVRQNLNKTGDVLRDGFSSATDQAWVAFDIDDQWTITAGKQSVQYGTFEYDYSGADIYLPTMIYGDIEDFKAGVNISYLIEKQTLNLQIVNSDATQYASDKEKKKAMGANLLWVGNLMDGKIRTRWGYGAFQHDDKKFYNWVTIGTQVNINKFIAELDFYHGDRNMDYGSIVNDSTLGIRPVRDQSMALNLKYNFGMWRPSIKGIWDKRHDRDFHKDAYERKGFETVLECYPFSSAIMKGLRFHLAYTYCKTEINGSDKNTNAHTIFAGTRWLFKVK